MIGERITKIIAAHFKLDEDDVTRDVKLNSQLDCDDMDLVEIAADLEEEFNIAISDEDTEMWYTVGHLIDFIVKATDAD